MDENNDTVIVATYGVTVTARSKASAAANVDEMVMVPLNEDMVGTVEEALRAKWPGLTFKARSERTDR